MLNVPVSVGEVLDKISILEIKSERITNTDKLTNVRRELDYLLQIDETIASLPEPDKSTATIEWEYAATVERLSPWVNNLTAALGMTPEQVDDLFRLAATK
jgi:hypothetical protein